MNQYQPVFSHYEIFLQLRAHDWNNKLVKTRIQYLAEILFFQQPLRLQKQPNIKPKSRQSECNKSEANSIKERERLIDQNILTLTI